jgi:hypothetical protein
LASAAQGDHRDQAAWRQLLHVFGRPLLGAIQQRAAERLIAHAQTVIDQQHGVQPAASVELLAIGGQIGLRQGQAQQQHGDGSHDQQHDIAKLHDLAISLHRLPQEVHGGPGHRAVTASIEQMNDDRPGGENGAGHGKLPGRQQWQKVHGRFPPNFSRRPSIRPSCKMGR